VAADSQFRLGVYKVSGILFVAPVFETVKDH